MNFHPVHRPPGTCSPSDQKEQCWLTSGQEVLRAHSRTLASAQIRCGWASGPFVLQIMVKHFLVLEQRHWLGKPLRYQAHPALRVSCMKNVWLSHAHLCFSYMQKIENTKNFKNYKAPTPQQLIINNYFLQFINQVLQKCLYITIQLLHS